MSLSKKADDLARLHGNSYKSALEKTLLELHFAQTFEPENEYRYFVFFYSFAVPKKGRVEMRTGNSKVSFMGDFPDWGRIKKGIYEHLKGRRIKVIRGSIVCTSMNEMTETDFEFFTGK